MLAQSLNLKARSTSYIVLVLVLLICCFVIKARNRKARPQCGSMHDCAECSSEQPLDLNNLISIFPAASAAVARKRRCRENSLSLTWLQICSQWLRSDYKFVVDVSIQVGRSRAYMHGGTAGSEHRRAPLTPTFSAS
jgi:hypothetical protein